jgi:hypothetical protein
MKSIQAMFAVVCLFTVGGAIGAARADDDRSLVELGIKIAPVPLNLLEKTATWWDMEAI